MTLIKQIQEDDLYQKVNASPLLYQAGLLLYKQAEDKEWSLIDCISFIVMKEQGIKQALTFDHHFFQAGFDPLLRREPDKI